MSPFCTIDLQYGGHKQEILYFRQFLLQTSDFLGNCRLTPMDLSENMIFFQTRQNSSMRLLCITDLQYGGQNQEI
jgi:hypothetical protein